MSTQEGTLNGKPGDEVRSRSFVILTIAVGTRDCKTYVQDIVFNEQGGGNPMYCFNEYAYGQGKVVSSGRRIGMQL